MQNKKKDGKKMTRVMVVDDEKDLREMIELLLKKEGYETQTAENGEDFLNKVDKFQPELVTLDVMMPGLKTREILEEIKNKKSKPKIILLTVVQFSKEEAKKLSEMGVVEYIRKPFDFEYLVGAVNKWTIIQDH
jgi:two-component system, OmpR family, alkaline phosphatase synthesis response regulator PhoP